METKFSDGDRQFITRENQNKDVLVKFENLLDDYFESDKARTMGLPTVQYCAEELCMSPNYFSDMLRKETGKTALNFIHDKVVDLGKTYLVFSENTITEIAYSLGFQYSQHFTRLFKKEVGCTPNEYRLQFK